MASYLKDELGVKTKEPQLAVGCHALVIVNWVPQFYDVPQRSDKQIIVDEEHLAGASAMVQNLLLLLTDQGMGSYWGSGGVLRNAEMFDYLNIPRNERLLGAIHIEYNQGQDESKERKAGKLRNERSLDWIREISL